MASCSTHKPVRFVYKHWLTRDLRTDIKNYGKLFYTQACEICLKPLSDTKSCHACIGTPEEFEQRFLELVVCMFGNQKYVGSNVLSKMQIMLLTLPGCKLNL